jgi:CheY-like chemotaxis protein
VRVLLFNDRSKEREAIQKALPKGTYQVEVAADERAALEAVARQSPELVVFSMGKSVEDFVRRLRGADASGQAYVIAVVEPSPTQKELAGLLGAGVNDFLRRPVIDGELLERMKAPARLLRWVKSVEKPTAFDLSSAPDMAHMRSWQKLGAIVAEDLGQMAGQAFTVCEGWPKRFSQTVRGATIPMSLAGDQLEVRVSVAIDGATAEWVKTALLSDASANDAAIDDVLREFANTAGGALKRSAMDESITFTTGIPFSDQLAMSAKRTCWTLELDGSSASIAVLGEIITKANQRVAAANLCEGMVIAYDVRNDAGVLLVPAGSRLTSTTAARLAKILGPRMFLEVAPAA